ncbi:YggT family protein [Cellulomonas sp. PhB143]|uniref:YggT family protein n=1 Tax=Cellulomonas sp. PhB143 TaxID=2485186 RepID=UPI000F4A5E80|nr:YggT family protein [Cellulomonas sp. PhB143]ROS77219.1 YggT family protein [Cellulomonas sp. PhB143]
MNIVWTVLGFLLFLYWLVLIGRLIFDWVQVFARDWRPRGVMLVLAEGVYTVTDPPLRAIRKVLPPLSIGQVRLDLAFIVLFVLVIVAQRIVGGLAS